MATEVEKYSEHYFLRKITIILNWNFSPALDYLEIIKLLNLVKIS